MWATKDFKRLETLGGIRAYRINPDARVLVLHKTKFDKNGNYLYSDINKSGFNELRKIALESGRDGQDLHQLPISKPMKTGFWRLKRK